MVGDRGKNVSYILIAEFDIDKGSTITFQYPEPTGEDTQLLAELMLPDGAHKRDEDWTVFLLGRSDSLPVKKSIAKKKESKHKKIEGYVYRYKEGSEDWTLIGPEKYQIMFINNERQGIEIVTKDGTKALFISKHADFELRQLEPSFLVVLTEDETAIGFRISSNDEEIIFKNQCKQLLGEEEKTLERIDSRTGPQEFLYCLNHVINHKDSSFKRGAQVKSMAICTQHPFIDVFKPSIVLALQKFFAQPTASTLEEYYNALNGIDLSAMPFISDRKKELMRLNNINPSKMEYSTFLNYTIKLPLKIPTTLFPDEVGNCNLITLIKKFGNQIMIIYNALLTQKRILYLGFDITSSDVCEYVLATCSMVCPPLTGFIKRAFPYTNLTYLDFLAVPGYIAGVTNPMFETHLEWWDVLCNINTGKVTVNSSMASPAAPEKYQSYDNEFLNQVNNAVASHYGDNVIKSLFHRYTQHIVEMSLDEEEFPDDASKQQEMEANKSRIEIFRKTLACEAYITSKTKIGESSAIKDPAVVKLVKRIRVRKNIDERQMINSLNVFLESVKSPEQCEEFVSLFPESTDWKVCRAKVMISLER
eukprot:TRINITY_DN1935_c0_g1_i3.p1 TRINITY_DN1935_c0_g1~~TRINITY_DN1935_c0_g1_i3.p1  ORF type:complete len:590 (+),score=185.84 TRINITY_DN1935_c0_g1_i3:58-1827(+)